MSRLVLLLVPGLLLLAGCAPDMSRQPRYDPLEESRFFADRRASRAPVEGTVARGGLRTDTRFHEGTENGELIERIPLPVTRELLERGRERFDIFCTPCHGRLGDGEGMIVLRGFRHPPSYHIDRLREAPDGHFFDVMTRGFGAMYSFASRIPPRDRWAITAYIRALQLSQSARPEDLPPDARRELEGSAR